MDTSKSPKSKYFRHCYITLQDVSNKNRAGDTVTHPLASIRLATVLNHWLCEYVVV